VFRDGGGALGDELVVSGHVVRIGLKAVAGKRDAQDQ
jgi:hypothetical protein